MDANPNIVDDLIRRRLAAHGIDLESLRERHGLEWLPAVFSQEASALVLVRLAVGGETRQRLRDAAVAMGAQMDDDSADIVHDVAPKDRPLFPDAAGMASVLLLLRIHQAHAWTLTAKSEWSASIDRYSAFCALLPALTRSAPSTQRAAGVAALRKVLDAVEASSDVPVVLSDNGADVSPWRTDRSEGGPSPLVGAHGIAEAALSVVHAVQTDGLYRIVGPPQVLAGLKDGSLHLMPLGSNVGGSVQSTNTGLIAGHAQFGTVSNAAALATTAWAVLSVVTMQHYLNTITRQLDNISKGLTELAEDRDREHLAELRRIAKRAARGTTDRDLLDDLDKVIDTYSDIDDVVASALKCATVSDEGRAITDKDGYRRLLDGAPRTVRRARVRAIALALRIRITTEWPDSAAEDEAAVTTCRKRLADLSRALDLMNLSADEFNASYGTFRRPKGLDAFKLHSRPVRRALHIMNNPVQAIAISLQLETGEREALPVVPSVESFVATRLATSNVPG